MTILLTDKTIKVHLEDGNSFITKINATNEEIAEYYKPGKLLNMGSVHDDMQPIKRFEILEGKEKAPVSAATEASAKGNKYQLQYNKDLSKMQGVV